MNDIASQMYCIVNVTALDTTYSVTFKKKGDIIIIIFTHTFLVRSLEMAMRDKRFPLNNQAFVLLNANEKQTK